MRATRNPRRPSTRIPGGENGHEKNWLRACKGGEPACSNFDYSGPLSEMVLMGNLAVRFPERTICGTASRWPSPTTPKPTASSRRIIAKAGASVLG